MKRFTDTLHPPYYALNQSLNTFIHGISSGDAGRLLMLRIESVSARSERRSCWRVALPHQTPILRNRSVPLRGSIRRDAANLAIHGAGFRHPSRNADGAVNDYDTPALRKQLFRGLIVNARRKSSTVNHQTIGMNTRRSSNWSESFLLPSTLDSYEVEEISARQFAKFLAENGTGSVHHMGR